MNQSAWKLPAALLAMAGAVAILALGAAWVLRTGFAYPCPFKFLFGLPCATCGATRSLAALASFDIGQSLRYNPLVLLGGIGGMAWRALPRRWTSLRGAGLPIFIGAVLLNWVYLILWLPR